MTQSQGVGPQAPTEDNYKSTVSTGKSLRSGQLVSDPRVLLTSETEVFKGKVENGNL